LNPVDLQVLRQHPKQIRLGNEAKPSQHVTNVATPFLAVRQRRARGPGRPATPRQSAARQIASRRVGLACTA
jgi:hypothetical protein